MPNNISKPHRGDAPKLVVMDLLGVFVEHDDAVRSALAAAFQAHGERVDPDVAGMAIGHPGLQGIYRVFQWLYPMERPNDSAVKSIHELAVKELQRLVRFGGAIQPSSSVVRLCEMWTRAGLQVAATTTLDARVVKVLLHCLGWDETPPFHALVLAEEVERPTPGPDMILQCMARLGAENLQEVAKVATHVMGLSDARQLGCGWNLLIDDGNLTMDQIAVLAPTAILDQASDLARLWSLLVHSDVELEDEIARFLARP